MSDRPSEGFPPQKECPNCHCRWSWSGSGWLCVDIHGRGTFLAVSRKVGDPIPVRTDCPLCHAPIPKE